MISSVIAMLLIMSGGTRDESPQFSYGHSQGQGVAVSPFNPAGMPARISTATAENSLGESWLEYSVSNLSGEEISGIYLRVFIADSSGKLIKVKESFSGERIAAGVTQSGRARITGTVRQQMTSFVAVSKVVTSSGLWQVDDSALETAIQSRLSRQADVNLNATFQPNVSITDDDRSQIFELILGDILHDEKKAERLQGQSRVIVLRDSVKFGLPQIPQTNLVALDQQQIQKVADKEQRVVFLNYEALTSEGLRVLAKITLRDVVAQRPGIHVPYKFTFQFTCIRNNGHWIIEKSIGYAQS